MRSLRIRNSRSPAVEDNVRARWPSRCLVPEAVRSCGSAPIPMRKVDLPRLWRAISQDLFNGIDSTQGMRMLRRH